MRAKHDYMGTFGVDDDEDIARTLAMFGGFTEGLQLFASFAMLMNFPRFNKMKGMGQIISWSIRDESLHCEGITRLFHAFCQERGCLTKAVKEDILDMCQKTVRLADAFIRSEEHKSELQSLMRNSYAVFCLKKKKTTTHCKQH